MEVIYTKQCFLGLQTEQVTLGMHSDKAVKCGFKHAVIFRDLNRSLSVTPLSTKEAWKLLAFIRPFICWTAYFTSFSQVPAIMAWNSNLTPHSLYQVVPHERNEWGATENECVWDQPGRTGTRAWALAICRGKKNQKNLVIFLLNDAWRYSCSTALNHKPASRWWGQQKLGCKCLNLDYILILILNLY